MAYKNLKRLSPVIAALAAPFFLTNPSRADLLGSAVPQSKSMGSVVSNTNQIVPMLPGAIVNFIDHRETAYRVEYRPNSPHLLSITSRSKNASLVSCEMNSSGQVTRTISDKGEATRTTVPNSFMLSFRAALDAKVIPTPSGIMPQAMRPLTSGAAAKFAEAAAACQSAKVIGSPQAHEAPTTTPFGATEEHRDSQSSPGNWHMAMPWALIAMVKGFSTDPLNVPKRHDFNIRLICTQARNRGDEARPSG
jgi:hypothetical protein